MKKKYTVITGASSGIGYETALAFAKKEKNLILVARRKDRLKSLKKRIQKEYPDLDIVLRKSDVSDRKAVYELYHSLTNYNIETWINNAGLGTSGVLMDADLEKIEQLIHVNVEATTILSTLYVKDYANVKGTQLINVSSAMGYVIALGNVAYSASKFFVSVLTEGLAGELKDAELNAKVLAPALTATDFIKQASDDGMNNQKLQLHTPTEVANFLIRLYESEKTVGLVNERNEFLLKDSIFPTFSL